MKLERIDSKIMFQNKYYVDSYRPLLNSVSPPGNYRTNKANLDPQPNSSHTSFNFYLSPRCNIHILNFFVWILANSSRM